MEPNQKVRY